MARVWEADPSADLTRRIGMSASDLGESKKSNGCPDIWELSNGDFAVIGRDLTAAYRARLPADASVVERWW